MDFEKILEIRDKLADLSYANNAFVSNIASNEVEFAGVGSTQVDGIVISQDSNGTLTIKAPDQVAQVFNHDEVIEHLSDVVTGTSYRVSDLLSSISKTGDTYTMLGAITAKFSYSSRMRLTDINELINTVDANGTATSYDIADLKNQLVSTSDDEGYITCQSWLVTLKSWIKSCLDCAENESPELDTTSPGTLSGMLNVISNVLTTIITAIFAALAAVFNVLWGIIVAIFSQLFNAIGNTLDESISVDPNSPNTFMKGVATSYQFPVNVSSAVWNSCKDDYSINYLKTPSVGMFFWQGDYYLGVKFNSYMDPQVSPESLYRWLVSLTPQDVSNFGINVFYSSGPANAWIKLQSERVRADRYYSSVAKMTESEAARKSADAAYYAACVCASELYRWIVSAPYQIKSNTSNVWVNNQVGDIVNTVGYGTPTYVACAWGLAMLSKIYNDGQFNFDFPTRTQLCDAANRLITYWFGHYARVFEPGLEEFHRNNINFIAATNPLVVSNYNLTDSGSPEGVRVHYSYDNSNFSIAATCDWYVHNTYAFGIKANCLPMSFGAKCDAITAQQAFLALTIISVAAISAAVIATKLGRSMRKKRIKKDILRTKKISDAKAAWEAQPDNKVLLDAYVTEVDRYNRLGKMFGWGSYDAANSWVNRPESGNSNPSSNSLVLSAIDRMKSQNPTDITLQDILNAVENTKDLIR